MRDVHVLHNIKSFFALFTLLHGEYYFCEDNTVARDEIKSKTEKAPTARRFLLYNVEHALPGLNTLYKCFSM